MLGLGQPVGAEGDLVERQRRRGSRKHRGEAEAAQECLFVSAFNMVGSSPFVAEGRLSGSLLREFEPLPCALKSIKIRAH